MNWIYSIAFDIANIGQVSEAEAAVERLDRATKSTGSSASNAANKFDNMGSRGESSFNRIRGAATRLLTQLAIVSTTIGSITTAAADDATNISIDFATGGKGTESIAFVRDLSDELGINLQSSKEGFKQLAGSMRGTSLEGQATLDIFKGLAVASGANRMSADQLNGAFLAFGQIASKGTVQAEELRGQLGERIPGAFGIAADAMGVTQAQLNKMMADGKLASDVFLPRFAAQLEKVFLEQAMEVAKGPAAAMERYKTSVFDLQVAFGTQLLPTVTMFLQEYLIPAINWIGEHITQLGHLAVVVGLVWGAMKLYSIWATTTSLITKILTAETWALTAAFRANPIGFVITAVAALAAGLIYAWKQFDGFRGFLVGMWYALKEVGSILYDFLIAPLMSLGKVVVGIFTFDKDMIASGLADAAGAAQKMAESAGARLAAAFTKGYQKGYNNEFGADAPGAGANDAVSNAFAGKSDSSKAGASTETKTTQGLEGITGRGSTKNITINLGNLVQELQITAQNVEQGVDEMADMVMRKLMQVLNSANQVQANG